MTGLFADRFVHVGASWIDLATGFSVRLLVALAGTTAQQLAWNERCASLSRLRHPLVNPLLDYGIVDGRRRFEAYALSSSMPAAGRTGRELLAHAARFLSSEGLPLTREQAALALRPASRGRAGLAGRPIGVVLQPRAALTRLVEAFHDGTPGGPIAIAVHGGSGSGLRTLRVLVARVARLAGFVPIASSLFRRWPAVRLVARERHVCVVAEAPCSPAEARCTADVIGDAGVASARGHFVLQFCRSHRARADGTVHVEPMGVTALTAMVYTDPACGPSPDQIWRAARQAGGNPRQFLGALRASAYPDGRSAVLVVHETTPPYVVDEERTKTSRPPRGRAASRRLSDAIDRARRLTCRGRHASAIRLLSRAMRVLEARGDAALASTCALQMGWTLRTRGRSSAAAELFQRARTLAADEVARVRAVLGLATAWTDDARLEEAEALCRAALVAVRLLDAPAVERAVRRVLSRSLYWQERHDEALIVLTPADGPASDAESLALVARLHAALGEHRQALIAAAEAASVAASDREHAAAARATALANHALGDSKAARAAAGRALGHCARAHLPLQGLRLRSSLLSWTQDQDEGAHRLVMWARLALRRPIPALYKRELEPALAAASCRRHAVDDVEPPAEAGLAPLRALLELAHAATDDRAALERIAADLLERLRATTVLIAAASPSCETILRSGRPWPSESRLVDRAIASGRAYERDASAGGLEGAAAIRYGEQTIGAIACRWSIAACVDPDRAGATICAAALAAAPALRGLLDRRQARSAEGGPCAELLGDSAQMHALREAVARAARAPFPVLVEGESGSGKELVARALHRLSPRRERRICAVNCAALADDLLEAELFGHARGAFTGAVAERPGLFEEADGGTLFLDEIGELSVRAQAKLLRVLQDGEVRRVGENLPRRVDTRIVAATNRCLEHEADAGRFRADLRYRLDVIRIRVPPLRDRATDVPQLAAKFWDDAMRRLGSGAGLAPDTLAALARYEWPGNVRELQNVIASMAVHAPRRGRVTPGVLPVHVARAARVDDMSFEAARLDFERRFVLAALARAGGRRSRAARLLGVTRQGLAKMLRRLEIEDGAAASARPDRRARL